MNSKTTKHNYVTKIENGKRWILLPELAFDVCANRSGDVVFPAGTKNVWCSFRSSRMTRRDEYGNDVRLNMYMKGSVVTHA